MKSNQNYVQNSKQFLFKFLVIINDYQYPLNENLNDLNRNKLKSVRKVEEIESQEGKGIEFAFSMITEILRKKVKFF